MPGGAGFPPSTVFSDICRDVGLFLFVGWKDSRDIFFPSQNVGSMKPIKSRGEKKTQVVAFFFGVWFRERTVGFGKVPALQQTSIKPLPGIVITPLYIYIQVLNLDWVKKHLLPTRWFRMPITHITHINHSLTLLYHPEIFLDTLWDTEILKKNNMFIKDTQKDATKQKT